MKPLATEECDKCSKRMSEGIPQPINGDLYDCRVGRQKSSKNCKYDCQ